MPKILHLITRLDMGGSAQNTLLCCRELAGEYDTVLVHGLARESGMSAAEKSRLEAWKREAEHRGVRFIPIGSLVRRIHPVRDILSLLVLLWHIRRERPEIVHTHTSKAGILGRLAARLAGVPHVVHTPHGHVFSGHFGRLAAGLFLALERFFARFTEKTVALTAGEKRDYVDLGVAPAEDVSVIPSGVELGEFAGERTDAAAQKRTVGFDPQRRQVGFVGWLLAIKGPAYLLNAMGAVWREHPDAELVFVGKGALEKPLRAQAAFAGCSGRVKFLGWRDDIARIMPLFDVFVLPSLNEGMGRVLVEAMAAGRPIVASRAGGIPDLVRHGENGLLVPPGDEAALAAGIALLLRDRGLAQRMGERGRRRCHEFGLPAMIAGLEALYRGLLAPPTEEASEPGRTAPPRPTAPRAGGLRGGTCQPSG
ncbi:MAG: glycosyltransferase family 4 protein [Desulfobacterales bacterium]|jgi:glycosyltransferase involved in cell wall biosynthesis|nr:glycosyltransferase family 4 protein [Desulfobacterales bacterium]